MNYHEYFITREKEQPATLCLSAGCCCPVSNLKLLSKGAFEAKVCIGAPSSGASVSSSSSRAQFEQIAAGNTRFHPFFMASNNQLKSRTLYISILQKSPVQTNDGRGLFLFPGAEYITNMYYSASLVLECL